MAEEGTPLGQTTTQEVLDDLVGLPEIAQRLGVGLYRVRRWVDRRSSTGCPVPVLRLRMGPIYSMADWRAWFLLWRLTRGSERWRGGGERKTDTLFG